MNSFISYFAAIVETIRTSWTGAKLTFKHLKKAIRQPRRANISITEKGYFQQDFAIETLQYPKEQLPVPDIGRYKLHNEIDDCIVCDKCAKICPVNCIDIVAIKSPEVIGETSDGTPKRLYAATFDIDMAKCCYCGLCTTVCPTECLTMTKEYEYSQYDVTKLVYAFANLSPEEAAEKQRLYDQYIAEKEALKKSVSKTIPATEKKEDEPSNTELSSPTVEEKNTTTTDQPNSKPVFKPKIPVKTSSIEKKEEQQALANESSSPTTEEKSTNVADKSSSKPVFKPKIPVKTSPTEKKEEKTESAGESSLPLSETKDSHEKQSEQKKPTFKPKIPPLNKND